MVAAPVQYLLPSLQRRPHGIQCRWQEESCFRPQVKRLAGAAMQERAYVTERQARSSKIKLYFERILEPNLASRCHVTADLKSFPKRPQSAPRVQDGSDRGGAE